MYLRNKKTGETVKFSGFGVTVVGEDGKTRNEIFDSLAELNEEWEDYEEEPKEYWYIDTYICERNCQTEGTNVGRDNFNKEIGNYFETKEEVEKAVEKLKAWKRLKDKGFRFDGWEDLQAEMGADDLMLFNRDIINTDNVIGFRMNDYHDCIRDLNTLFGGEEWAR